MDTLSLLLIAIGLSMDAFAVSICKGLALGKIKTRHMLLVGAWFGGFQALMPALGYLLGSRFEQYIVSIDHWIAFVLLGLIGGNMIRESLGKDESEESDASLAMGVMFLLAIATSIDALAVGVTLAFLSVDIIPAVLSIGVTTFALSAAGVKIGSVVGLKYKHRAEFAGGVILCLMGLKILLEHLGVL